MEVYVDSDFNGNWDKDDSLYKDIAHSRLDYIIIYNGRPLVWITQFHIETTLSRTESDYIGLTYAMREVIPIMPLLKALKIARFPNKSNNPKVTCKIFEDNSGMLDMEAVHKNRKKLRTST